MVKSTLGQFDSIDAFFLAAGGELNPDGESWHFEDDDELDAFVATNTRFQSWELMQAAAVEKML